MPSMHRHTAILAALSLCACGDSTGPGARTTTRRTDPTGDTFNTVGQSWDLSAMTVSRDTAGVTVRLDFATTVIPPFSGDTNAMIALVDFDTDQDSTTGVVTQVDEFRLDGGSSGMGSEFTLDLANYDPDSSVAVYAAAGTATGRVKPVFAGKTVTITIPRALLGDDDGFLNAAAIVGSFASPSDIVPESGHLQLGQSSPFRVPTSGFRVQSPESRTQRMRTWDRGN